MAAQPAFERIEPLIDYLFADLGPLLDGPLVVYGHSMGALVAFEFVRRMRATTGRLPVALFVSGRRAPHKPMRHPHLHSMPEEDFLAHLRQMGGTPDSLLDRRQWRERYLPTMRADLKLSDVYSYHDEPPLACPLHAFLGEDDHEMYREDWIAWKEQAGGAFSCRLLPSGHIFSAAVQSDMLRRMIELTVALVPTLRAQTAAAALPPAALPRGSGLGPLQEQPC